LARAFKKHAKAGAETVYKENRNRMKYFEIDRIKEAIKHLQKYHSTWVLVPLVLAVNKVGYNVPRKLDR
jgi:hypothetical protein